MILVLGGTSAVCAVFRRLVSACGEARVARDLRRRSEQAPETGDHWMQRRVHDRGRRRSAASARAGRGQGELADGAPGLTGVAAVDGADAPAPGALGQALLLVGHRAGDRAEAEDGRPCGWWPSGRGRRGSARRRTWRCRAPSPRRAAGELGHDAARGRAAQGHVGLLAELRGLGPASSSTIHSGSSASDPVAPDDAPVVAGADLVVRERHARDPRRARRDLALEDVGEAAGRSAMSTR